MPSTVLSIRLQPCTIHTRTSSDTPQFVTLKHYLSTLPAVLRERTATNSKESITRLLEQDTPRGAKVKVTVSKALGQVSLTMQSTAPPCSTRSSLFAWLHHLVERIAPDHDAVYDALHHAGRLDMDVTRPWVVLDVLSAEVKVAQSCWTAATRQREAAALAPVHP